MVRFAHIADCHLGSWKEPKLQELNLEAFSKAIDICIKNNVEFVLISGDLFDSAIPPIDILKSAASKLRELKEKNIPCYLIAGSHDYSVSGKTFIDVLEKAGLCINVSSEEEYLKIIETDNIVIAGISGKKGELDKELIRKVRVPELNKDKLKILALHTTLSDNKTSEIMEGIELNELPKGFDYYAFGHIHKPYKREYNNSLIVYSGPLFPDNFGELEELGNGGFYIIEHKNNKFSIERVDLKLKDTLIMEFSADGKNPTLLTSEIISALRKENIDGKIVMLKVYGTLSNGKTSEVNFNEIKNYAEKAFILLKNISKLKSPETKIDIEVKAGNVDEIEVELLEKINENYRALAPQLFEALNIEKIEGETTSTFEKRLLDNIRKVIEI